MPNYFFDTSALVKRYYREPGTDRVDALIEAGDTDVIISSLASIETVSAFRRKHNIGDISQGQMVELVGAFFTEAMEVFVVLPLDDSLARYSFELVLEDDLRTLDSLQLSAGLVASEEIADLTFVTADRELAAIAADHGLDIEVPT